MEGGATGKAQLLFALAILIAFAGALTAAGGGSPASPAGGADSSGPARTVSLATLSERLEPRVARRVEQLRELAFDRIPTPEVVDADYLNRLGARDLRRTDALRGSGADEAELRMLGLLDPREELESIYGTTGDLAAAAYDPRTDRMYVVSDAVSANRALVEFLLAHELTHALEDQRFDLSGGARLEDDAALARGALTEGTATSIMIDYANRHIGALDLLDATAAIDADGGDVPAFYMDQVTWAYLGGARFIVALRRLGGGWKLVDHAIAERPPASTEQVLHPDKYVSGEPPLPVRIADAELRRRGWRRADGGVVGELTTSQLLEVGVDKPTAEQAAAGWGGDRYELWRQAALPADCAHPCREGFVLAIDWVMETPDDAATLERALAGYVEDGLGGERAGSSVWRLDGGFAALRRGGDAVALIFAPDSETAAAVAGTQ